jgi:hypothetical protein
VEAHASSSDQQKCCSTMYFESSQQGLPNGVANDASQMAMCRWWPILLFSLFASVFMPRFVKFALISILIIILLINVCNFFLFYLSTFDWLEDSPL